MPLDKTAIIVNNFKGLDLVDNLEDSYDSEMPFEYALECQNLEFNRRGGIRTRASFDKYVSELAVTGAPRQMWKINNLNNISQTDRWLVLTYDGTTGRLYDTQVTGPATNPVLTVVGMKYAFVLNAFGRMYISPWSDWATSIDAQPVYVYNGNYNARSTGGANISIGGFTAAVAAGGNVTPGLHQYTCLLEYDTGFISMAPWQHATGPLAITTTAANATINFSAIPVGGTGCIRRHIIMTKVVVNNNGRGLMGYEPFFAVTINDNTTTTASFDKPDSALVESAKDYIVEGNSSTGVPSVVSMAEFGNRMVYMGISKITITPPGYAIDLNSYIFVSEINSPEQILAYASAVSGLPGMSVLDSPNLISIAPTFTDKIMTGAELNKIFYIFKENSTFSITADDESSPSEWTNPAVVDGGKGAFPFGIARVAGTPTPLIDGGLLVMGNHGLAYFNGSFDHDNLLDKFINLSIIYSNLRWAKVAIDSIRKQLIIRTGDPVLNDTPKLIIGNYYNGMDSAKIRWGIYLFSGFPYSYPSGQESLIISDFDLRKPNTAGDSGFSAAYASNYPLITILHRHFVSGSTWNIEIISETNTRKIPDFHLTKLALVGPEIAIAWKYTTGFTPNTQGEVYTFGPLKVRIYGSDIYINKWDLRNISSVVASGINESTSNGKYLSFNLNEVGEQLRIEIGGNSLTSYADIFRLILFATVQSLERVRS